MLGGGSRALKSACFEPEADTHEVLNALLLGCERRRALPPSGRAADGAACLYVDIGCNLGYFAAQAASLGAAVDCYEPTPFFVDAARRTFRLNAFATRDLGGSGRSDSPPSGDHQALARGAAYNISQLAVVTTAELRRRTLELMGDDQGSPRAPYATTTAAEKPHPTMHSRGTYAPCGIGDRDANNYGTTDPSSGRFRKGWEARLHPIRSVLFGRHITLLKIDIDSHDGGTRPSPLRVDPRVRACFASACQAFRSEHVPSPASPHVHVHAL